MNVAKPPPDNRRAIKQHLPRSSTDLILSARPENFPLSPDETTLIIVDMQNAYASRGGYLDLAGFDISGAERVKESVARAIAAARKLGIQVIFFQNGWDPERHEAGSEGSPNWWKSNALKLMRKDVNLSGKLLTKGTWDYEIVSELKPQPNDVVIQKPRYSGFAGTQFDSILRSRGTRNLLFVGVAANVCVESTIRDAFFHEYFPVLIEDAALQAGPPELHAATVYNVETFFGWVSSCDDLCRLAGM